MKKKGKKKGGGFKLSFKVDDPEAQKMEAQMKKKILQDKLIVSKAKADEAVKKQTEARTRYLEVLQYRKNEEGKYNSIESDFFHQNNLLQKLTEEKKHELLAKLEDRKKKYDKLNETLNQMQEDHKQKIGEKMNLLADIKNNMENLSNTFNQQLSDIQKELKQQTENVSRKWEHNRSDHISNFEKEVENYDISKNDK